MVCCTKLGFSHGGCHFSTIDTPFWGKVEPVQMQLQVRDDFSPLLGFPSHPVLVSSCTYPALQDGLSPNLEHRAEPRPRCERGAPPESEGAWLVALANTPPAATTGTRAVGQRVEAFPLPNTPRQEFLISAEIPGVVCAPPQSWKSRSPRPGCLELAVRASWLCQAGLSPSQEAFRVPQDQENQPGDRDLYRMCHRGTAVWAAIESLL